MNYYSGFNYQQGTPVWVQGEAGAKSFSVAPGQKAIMLDSEQPRFYMKSVDASGMPSPLRIFEFKEVQAISTSVEPSKYITREEFEKAIALLKEGKNEQSVV